MKKFAPFVISLVILLVFLFLIYLFGEPAPPVLSKPSGHYAEPFELKISSQGQNEAIHYTLDGSIPTKDSPIYNGPILVTDRSNHPNDIAMIPTISYRFIPPEGEVNKITIVRARSINQFTKAMSQIVTQSYLVGQDIRDRYSLPILSLVADPKDFFDQETGIYVTGEAKEVAAKSEDYYYFWPANYHQRGDDWERSIHFEYFNSDGTLKYSQNGLVRIHGDASRSFRQKSLRLYANEENENDESFDYPFFPNLIDHNSNKKIEQFETLILRNAGTDFDSSFIRDNLIQGLVAHTSVTTQATEPVIVFLNGEYWGIYFLYERYDEAYFKYHYGTEPENLIVLERDGDVFVGVEKDKEIYQNLLDYVSTQDLDDNSVYAEIKKQIDFDNFIDYQITEIFIGHMDWPKKNIKFWRSRSTIENFEGTYGQDGRWRWLLFDLDHGFIDFEVNGIVHATNPELPTELLRSLLTNPDFRNLFLNRFADHLNTTFQTDRVIREINQLEAVLEPEMQEQIDRWHSSGQSMEKWHNNVDWLRIFAQKRPEIMRRDLVEFFELDGTYQLLLSFDEHKGNVHVNSIEINPKTPGINIPGSFEGTYFQNIPVTITAKPEEGFMFSHWEGSIDEDNEDPIIEILSMEDLHLQPIFIPIK